VTDSEHQQRLALRSFSGASQSLLDVEVDDRLVIQTAVLIHLHQFVSQSVSFTCVHVINVQ